MIPVGHKIQYTKIKHKPYDCENCTYKKYGNEIKIKDFVNAGRENTEAKKIIGKTVSMEELKRLCKDIPEQKEIVNMNIDPYMANRLMKTAQISHEKIMKMKAEAEKQAEMKKEKEEQPKGGDVNE